MRLSSTLCAILGLLGVACTHPDPAAASLSRPEQAGQATVRAYYLAINGKDPAALSKVLAERVQLSVGAKAWGKATELKNRADQWARDPAYAVEIRSITTRGEAISARVVVTYTAHGRTQRQEIENMFQVQDRQIVHAVLAP